MRNVGSRAIVLATAAALVAISGYSHRAMANSIQIPTAPTITGTGPYTYTYTVQVTGNNFISPGDFFTLTDFAGYVSGSAAGPTADWSVFNVSGVATTPAGTPVFSSGVSPTTDKYTIQTDAGSETVLDNPNISDITFQYNGTVPIPLTVTSSNAIIGTFTLESTIFALSTGPFSHPVIVGSDTQLFDDGSTAPGQNADNYDAPKGTGGSAAPLPAAAFGGFGLMGAMGLVGFVKRRREVKTV